jgi:hypothetical protein
VSAPTDPAAEPEPGGTESVARQGSGGRRVLVALAVLVGGYVILFLGLHIVSPEALLVAAALAGGSLFFGRSPREMSTSVDAESPPKATSTSTSPVAVRAPITASASKQPSASRLTLELTAGVLWVVGLAVVAVFGGSLVQSKLASKVSLCNLQQNFAADTGQGQSTSQIAHCGVYTVASEVAQVFHYLGIVALVGVAVIAILSVLGVVGKVTLAKEPGEQTKAAPAPVAATSSMPSAQAFGRALGRSARYELLGAAAAVLLVADLWVSWNRYVYAAYPSCNVPANTACGPPSYYTGGTTVPGVIQLFIYVACIATIVAVVAKVRAATPQAADAPRWVLLDLCRLVSGALATAGIVYAAISPPADFGGPWVGAYAGLLLGAVVTYSGYRAYRARRASKAAGQ